MWLYVQTWLPLMTIGLAAAIWLSVASGCSGFHIGRSPENQAPSNKNHIQFIGYKNFPDRLLANVLTSATGSWHAVFYVAAILNIVAAVMALVVLRPMRRRRARMPGSFMSKPR